ncbi:coiled-coil domain-containing protein 87 [Oxyura jamaicensis]|uniref:coiled-coil domain-containing protein 87 n=1 Tax=Oxyura jamaicensis TaxID=8884 RepID=UPI0015A54B8E|nr:coiled-coil domain-containing protein 87 [Oxyura jamaicensis]
MEPPLPRRSLADPALEEKLAADLRELRAIAGADLRAVPCLLPLARPPPRAPRTPRPPPPATDRRPGTAAPRRARSLPVQTEQRHRLEKPGVPPPPRPRSLPALPTPAVPPCATAAALDLRWLTRRVPSDGHRLPPLLAALTRRPRDAARLRWLRGHQTQRPGALPAPPPALGVTLLWQPELAEGAVRLRVQPPLCPEPLEDAVEAEAVPGGELRALYERLAAALPGERLRLEHEPLLEPAAHADDLGPEGPRGSRVAARSTTAPRRREPRSASPLQDYLRYLAGSGSDFLHAIFNLGEEEEEEEEPVKAPQATAEPRQPAAVTTATPAVLQQLQRRLRQLWAALLVPGRQQLAMATKYAGGTALAQLPAALELWEEAAGLIQQREQLLAWLEGLEVRASDPNRFFCRAPNAFAARAGEARARGRLRAAVSRCEGPLRAALRRLREEFGDVVTLRGRPYEEKMRRDAVEMLYRLQQGRRAAALGAILRHRGAEMSPGGTGGT